MCEIERYVSEAAENTTEENYIEELERNLTAAEEILNARQNFINNLQKELEEAGTLCKKQNSEIVSLREEKDKLVKQKYHDDYVIENQKYQLGKWAKENEELQEENEALKFFARRYLVVE